MKFNLIIFVLLLSAFPLLGKRVLILKSNNFSAYSTILTGFSIESKAEVKVVSMDNPTFNKDKMLKHIKSDYDLVFAIGDKALALSIKQNSKPVIFSMVLNPQKHKLDPSRVTGIQMELSPRAKIGSIAALLSPAKNIGIISSSSITDRLIKSNQSTASLFDLKLISMKIKDPRNIIASLEKDADKIDAIWMMPDRAILNPRNFNQLSKFAIKHQKPLYVLSPILVEKGGLYTISPNYQIVGQQAARIANKVIFSNIPMKYIPISEPDSFELTLNYSVAQEIQLTERIAIRALKYAASKSFAIKVVK